MTDFDLAAAPDGGRPVASGTSDSPDDGGTLRTGDPRVDRVLAAVDAAGERPLAEHVAVFEQAHDQLRRALDAPAEQS